MILHGIKAHNFMSLRDCEIKELDKQINFLVGPNGCGKTTVFRVLKAVRDTLNFGKTAPFEQLCTRKVSPQELDLTIDVEFNTDWEQELITTFLCASLSKPDELRNILSGMLPQLNIQVNAEGGSTVFSNWLLRVFCPKSLPFLFRGKIHLSYRGRDYEHLRINYTFEHNKIPITITVRPLDSILLRDVAPTNISGGFPPENALVSFFHETNNLQSLVDLFTSRAFPVAGLFDPVACLQYLALQKVILTISGMNSQQAYLPAQQRFAELSGNKNLANSTNQIFSFGAVLRLILNHAFVFTNNLRVPFSDDAVFELQEAATSDINLDDERKIPLLLYRLKNGDSAERARFQRIQESFKVLTGGNLSFDIRTRLNNQTPSLSNQTPSLNNQAPSLNNQAPSLSFAIQIIDSEGEIPLTYHGAGVSESLILSTILDESEGRVVLLDEPASNLHPGWQHELLNVLHTVPGQVIVVTHSAHMLPTTAEDFRKVRRLQKTDTGTIVKGLDNSTHLKLQKIEKELNKSSDVGGLLFAKGVILVEGETETNALREWFPKSSLGKGKTFTNLNLSLYWVGGKTNFPFYLRFLSAFGVPWVVICDGDALPLNSNGNNNLWHTLKDLKLIDSVPDSTAFEELKTLVEEVGVYTANTAPGENFECIPDVKNFKENNQIYGSGKVLQGGYVAQQIPCPKEIEEILQNALRRFNILSGKSVS